MTEDEIRNRQAIRHSVVQQVRMGQPHTGSVIACVDRIFAVEDRFRQKKSEIEADQKLSAMGRSSALANVVRTELMPALAKETRPIRKALGYAASQRAALEDPVRVDPGDMVGELRRQEMRSFLRSLPDDRRLSAAHQLIQDDAGAAAILDAAPVLSGLPEQYYGELRQQVAERVNGPKLSEIEGVEADYKVGQSAVDILLGDLVPASGLTVAAFAETMKPFEDAADA